MFIIIIVILLFVGLYYFETRQNFRKHIAPRVRFVKPQTETIETSWQDVVETLDLDPSVKKNHQKYVANVRQYSSGANFASVDDDRRGTDSSNYVGFARKYYIPIDPTARQVPDYYPEVNLRNRHISFTGGV
jgi:hypothetical protein